MKVSGGHLHFGLCRRGARSVTSHHHHPHLEFGMPWPAISSFTICRKFECIHLALCAAILGIPNWSISFRSKTCAVDGMSSEAEDSDCLQFDVFLSCVWSKTCQTVRSSLQLLRCARRHLARLHRCCQSAALRDRPRVVFGLGQLGASGCCCSPEWDQPVAMSSMRSDGPTLPSAATKS